MRDLIIPPTRLVPRLGSKNAEYQPVRYPMMEDGGSKGSDDC